MSHCCASARARCASSTRTWTRPLRTWPRRSRGFGHVEDQLGVAESLETLGLVWHARSPGDAAKLLGASLAVRKSIGAALDVVERHEEAKTLQQQRADEWRAGLAMSTEQTIPLLESLVASARGPGTPAQDAVVARQSSRAQPPAASKSGGSPPKARVTTPTREPFRNAPSVYLLFLC